MEFCSGIFSQQNTQFYKFLTCNSELAFVIRKNIIENAGHADFQTRIFVKLLSVIVLTIERKPYSLSYHEKMMWLFGYSVIWLSADLRICSTAELRICGFAQLWIFRNIIVLYHQIIRSFKKLLAGPNLVVNIGLPKDFFEGVFF